MMTKVRGIPVSYGDAEFWIYHFITPKAPEKEVKKVWRYHTHVYYEIHVILTGTAHFMHENKKITVEAGEMIIFSPGSRHYTCSINQNVTDKVLCLSLVLGEGESGYYDLFLSALNEASGYPRKISDTLLAQAQNYSDKIDPDNVHDRCLRKAIAYETVLVLLEELEAFRESNDKRRDSPQESEQNVELDILINSYYSLSEISEFLEIGRAHV